MIFLLLALRSVFKQTCNKSRLAVLKIGTDDAPH